MFQVEQNQKLHMCQSLSLTLTLCFLFFVAPFNRVVLPVDPASRFVIFHFLWVTMLLSIEQN